ncbi:MAG TPA: bifunctional adenosylcobinamide kinase/adenosylcobinamide-phosphate guanylyltransferase [Gaiellaceae bacterium]|jgi:adenosyl cobinamide kinase/adenosyl cobinamide phosphate guanylyltransferase
MVLLLLVGGARAGKSRLAVERAAATGENVVFIATAEARDEEMTERIARHRAERPADWQTVEEPLCLDEALVAAPPTSVVVVDCLSLWVANLLEQQRDVEPAAVRAAALAAERVGTTIAVSNEVGLGVVPVTPLGRSYRDALGRVNAIWAEAAAEAYFVVAGKALRLGDV